MIHRGSSGVRGHAIRIFGLGAEFRENSLAGRYLQQGQRTKPKYTLTCLILYVTYYIQTQDQEKVTEESFKKPPILCMYLKKLNIGACNIAGCESKRWA